VKIYHTFERSATRPLAVAVGFFDGVHLGHRELIRQTLLQRRPGWRAGAITFANHPVAYLRPGEEPPLLQSCEERINVLAALGIEECFLVPFDRAVATMSAQRFIDEVLLARLGVRAVVTGASFRFGERRGGDTALLSERLEPLGVRTVAVEAVCDAAGERISSTRIRTLVRSGDCEGADALLGASFSIRGIVERGAGRGHDLGFPTANLRVESALLPCDGVYATTARYDGRDYMGLLSIGSNPQFAGERRTVEVWLRDFSHTIYGEQLALRELRFVREQKTFADLSAFIEQMERDREAVAFPSYG